MPNECGVITNYNKFGGKFMMTNFLQITSLSLFLSFTNTLYTEWVQLRMSEKFQLPEKLPETTNQ